MRCFAAALLLLPLVTGCADRVVLQRVNVPVPVYCEVQEPARPDMPTEHLAGDASVDAFTQAAIAEIETREAYEIELRAAVQGCIYSK